MAFFSDASRLLGGFEPKRQFRFTVNFSAIPDVTFMAKTCNKPAYKIEVAKHNYLNHEYKFPKIVTWEPVKVSFVDAMEPNVGTKFYNALLNAGYFPPPGQNAAMTGITKVQSVMAIGTVTIRQLDGGGVLETDILEAKIPVNTSYHEEWTLKNAWITDVKFGDLDYSKQELVTIDVGLEYDWATFSSVPGGMPIPLS